MTTDDRGSHQPLESRTGRTGQVVLHRLIDAVMVMKVFASCSHRVSMAPNGWGTKMEPRTILLRLRILAPHGMGFV